MNNIDVLRDLPPSLSTDEKAEAIAKAATEWLLQVDKGTKTLNLFDDWSQMPDGVLKHLAWAYHVDGWSDRLPRKKRETLVKSAINWHRHKGTVGLVETVVTELYQDAKLQENWEYGGRPYHFRILLGGLAMDKEFRATLLERIRDVKNTRSILDGLYYLQNVESESIHVGAYLKPGGGFTTVKTSTDVDIELASPTGSVGAYLMPRSAKTYLS